MSTVPGPRPQSRLQASNVDDLALLRPGAATGSFVSPASARVLLWLADTYRRGLTALLNALGPRAAYAFVAMLARRVYQLHDPLRARSEAQCHAALGARYPATEICRIAQRAFIHRAWNLTDLMLARRRIRPATLPRYGGVIPEPYLGLLLAAQRQRHPVMLLTAYYGPFDLLPLFLGCNGLRASVVYRPHANPDFDAYRRSIRAASGCELIPVSQALVRLPEILGAGGTVAILADHAAAHGVPVTFLGLPTAVPRTVGLLAARYGAVVTVAGIRRQATPFRFELAVVDFFEPSAWSHVADPVTYITQRYVAALEQLVLGDPTQYLWAHTRGRPKPSDQPAGEP